MLLENDGILPLGPDAGSVAVIGPMADTLRGLFAAYTPPAALELFMAMSQGLEGSMAGVVGDPDGAHSSADEHSPDPMLDAVTQIFHSTGAIIDPIELDRAIEDLYPNMGTIAAAITQYAPATSIKGCDWTRLDENGIDEAVAAAQAADLVVLAVGGEDRLGGRRHRRRGPRSQDA